MYFIKCVTFCIFGEKGLTVALSVASDSQISTKQNGWGVTTLHITDFCHLCVFCLILFASANVFIFTGEAASQREAISSLSQKLAKAETRANSMENEVHRVTLQLTEKGLLLEVLQREKDQAAARIKELESALQAEREMVSRAGARQEATQERLAQAQSEGMLLRQQLEEAQNKGAAKERAVTDAQERFGDILSKLRSDCEERVQLVEERNKELASKAADLRDQIYKLEEEKSEREVR